MEKVYYKMIDYTKVICAILVVCVHTGPFLSINEEINFFLVQVLARCAVPFFFLSSAFFFFKKIDFSLSLKEEKNFSVLKKYLFHLGKMYLFWSLIYFSIQLVSWVVNGFSLHALLLYVRDFIFRGSYYHLWFLPALMFAVAFVYFLLDKWKDTYILYLSVVLYIIGMCINVYESFFMNLPVVGKLLNIYSTIFATSRNGLFFGCIFVIMGYYIAQKHISMDKNKVMIGMLVSFALLILEAYSIRSLGIMNSLTCMYLSLLPLILMLFIWLLHFKSDIKPTPFLRNSSTLLYLVHCYFTFVLQYVPIVKDYSMLYFIATMFISMVCIIIYLQISKKWTFLRKVI